MHTLALVPLAAALACAVEARSQQIIAALAGIPSPNTVIDFGANLLPNFTPVSTQFPGITITHASYFTTGVSNNLVGGFLTNNFSAGPPNTLSIVFAQPLTDLSFVYHQISTAGPSVIRVLLQGVPVDSFSGTWNQSQPNNFFGFTNQVFDELQIDFQADFNVDTLAFNPVGGAACQFYNGTGVNLPLFTCATLPVLGSIWQGAIATTPNTLLTGIAFSEAGFAAPLPLFGGELLIQTVPAPILFTGLGAHPLSIPNSPGLTGFALPFQGLRIEGVGPTFVFQPLNALRVIVGT
jgi:hypothetical protein